ncbi:hypothetical protein HDV05_001900 [Chytridiales sp. JEL 0842]|nr:hypothetical protein HDV05_001900 [Chytridiales sp. JEL 0842]
MDLVYIPPTPTWLPSQQITLRAYLPRPRNNNLRATFTLPPPLTAPCENLPEDDADPTCPRELRQCVQVSCAVVVPGNLTVAAEGAVRVDWRDCARLDPACLFGPTGFLEGPAVTVPLAVATTTTRTRATTAIAATSTAGRTRATSASTTPSSTGSDSQNQGQQTSQPGGASSGLIIGLSIAGAFVFLALGTFLWNRHRASQRRRRRQESNLIFEKQVMPSLAAAVAPKTTATTTKQPTSPSTPTVKKDLQVFPPSPSSAVGYAPPSSASIAPPQMAFVPTPIISPHPNTYHQDPYAAHPYYHQPLQQHEVPQADMYTSQQQQMQQQQEASGGGGFPGYYDSQGVYHFYNKADEEAWRAGAFSDVGHQQQQEQQQHVEQTFGEEGVDDGKGTLPPAPPRKE